MWQPWLDPKQDPVGLKQLLSPYDSEKMQYWPVTKRMNTTCGDDYVAGRSASSRWTAWETA